MFLPSSPFFFFFLEAPEVDQFCSLGLAITWFMSMFVRERECVCVRAYCLHSPSDAVDIVDVHPCEVCAYLLGSFCARNVHETRHGRYFGAGVETGNFLISHEIMFEADGLIFRQISFMTWLVSRKSRQAILTFPGRKEK